MPFGIGWVKNFDKIALSCTVKEIEANFCFSTFGKNSKIQNGCHFGEEEKNFFNCQEYIARKFVFSPFLTKIRKFKMPPYVERGNFFGKLPKVHCSDTLWVENFNKIPLSRTVKEIEANFCFAIFGKNSKIQNGRHFWGGENFLKITNSTFLS